MKTKRLLANLVCCGVVAAASLGAQVPTKAPPVRIDRADPCCDVVAINLDKGTITAQMRTSGTVKWFSVAVEDRRLLTSIKVGDPLWDAPPCKASSSSGATTLDCGSNVPRGADTRPKAPPPPPPPTPRPKATATDAASQTCYLRTPDGFTHAVTCSARTVKPGP